MFEKGGYGIALPFSFVYICMSCMSIILKSSFIDGSSSPLCRFFNIFSFFSIGILKWLIPVWSQKSLLCQSVAPFSLVKASIAL